MPDNYQLSTQINDLHQRLAALEAQIALLSNRLGVPTPHRPPEPSSTHG